MKNNLFKAILYIGILMLGGALAVKSQTDLNGRYAYEIKGENPSTFFLTFERENSVYYSYFYKGAGTIEGNWTRAGDVIKAVLVRGDAKWTINLKQKGDNLEISETLSPMNLPDIPEFKTVLPVGTVFRKVPNKPTAPDLSAAEIGKRVTQLLKSIKTPKDISPENIVRQTGIKVSLSEENRNEYGFGGNVKDVKDWTYGFIAYPYPSKDNKTTDTLRFSFDYQLHEPKNPEMPQVFQSFNLENLSKDLQTAGFSAPTPRYGTHGRLLGWNFSRGTVQVSVSTRAELNSANPKPDATHYVEMIIVSFLNR